MRPRKLAIRRLPALAKRFNGLSRGGFYLEPKAEARFFSEVVSSFFEKDPWLGRVFLKSWAVKKGYSLKPADYVKAMADWAVKAKKAAGFSEAASFSAQKVKHYIQELDFLVASLSRQRALLVKDTKYGMAFHKMINVLTGLRGELQLVLEELAKGASG
jgi:hypothetical protein